MKRRSSLALLAGAAAASAGPARGQQSADPVGSGFIQSLAKPGGNVTGVAQPTAALSAKCVELIRELLPRAQRVAMLANLVDPFHKAFLEQVTLAGRTAGLEMHPVMIRDPGQLESAFAQAAGEKVAAIVVQPSLPIERVADLALEHRVPTACSSRPFVVAGGLLGYVANPQEQYRKVATYVDRLLKGAKPADLPVQEPTTFEILFNMKTARALGLAIPPSILSRMDEVVECDGAGSWGRLPRWSRPPRGRKRPSVCTRSAC